MAQMLHVASKHVRQLITVEEQASVGHVLHVARSGTWQEVSCVGAPDTQLRTVTQNQQPS